MFFVDLVLFFYKQERKENQLKHHIHENSAALFHHKSAVAD